MGCDSMNYFRDEFVAALKGGGSYRELLSIVLRYKTCGASQRETYDTLESIRAELGCSEDGDQENPICEPLEDIMDRVWGFCPPAEAIWTSSLSDAQEA